MESPSPLNPLGVKVNRFGTAARMSMARCWAPMLSQAGTDGYSCGAVAIIHDFISQGLFARTLINPMLAGGFWMLRLTRNDACALRAAPFKKETPKPARAGAGMGIPRTNSAQRDQAQSREMMRYCAVLSRFDMVVVGDRTRWLAT